MPSANSYLRLSDFSRRMIQLYISIVMDEPKEGYYGGQVCGPVFKEVAERCASYLNIPSDKNLESRLRHHHLRRLAFRNRSRVREIHKITMKI